MKHILSLSIALLSYGAAWGNPNWKIHNTFDEEVTRIIDTGDYTYFISRTQPYNQNVKAYSRNLYSLFRYDKEMDELLTLSTDNLLSSNVVQCIEYSPEKRMLVVVYANHDVDLIYDNGKTVNIPSYRLADVSSGKDVNSIFIDADADRIYLSTGFGYVALNDKKQEVAESRIYGTPVLAMSRLGDQLLILTADALLAAPTGEPRFNLSDYTKVETMKQGKWLGRLSDEHTLVVDSSGGPHAVYVLTHDSSGWHMEKKRSGTFHNMEHNSLGISISDSNHLFQFKPDGHFEPVVRHEDDRKMVCATHDLTELWYGDKRKGIRSRRYDRDSDDPWSLTRDFMRPNSPAPFKSTHMAWHPEYGLLVVNHGIDRNFQDNGIVSPILLSGYKDGLWSNLSPVYTWPEGVSFMTNPNGLGVDPNNKDMVYFGSILHGMARINMTDGTDNLHMSRTSDPYRTQPGYVEIVPDQKGTPSPALNGKPSWAEQCMFSGPEFDSYGNMWAAHCDYDDQTPLQTHLFCWEAADRAASTGVDTYRPIKVLKVPGLDTTGSQFVKPLTTSRNRDVLVWTNTNYEGEVVLIHTNGTPTDSSDDKVVKLSTFTDQDGVDFDVHNVGTFFEDPLTGYVWVGHLEGVFYFNPSEILDGKRRVYRIKVARNDGTNLADYLLNQVKVNKIATDGSGRKWFATSGAGVVCTSSDGRTIEEELTTSNSPLPDDIVYGLGYIPSTNSMMFSTDMGLAEYFMSARGDSGSESQVRAYPNPVRPDYFGYVTIDGVPDGNLVKIADSRGNLVKELGRVSGGEVKWDVTDLAFRRVGSGVYFILSSPDENSGNVANVGKILVVN